MKNSLIFLQNSLILLRNSPTFYQKNSAFNIDKRNNRFSIQKWRLRQALLNKSIFFPPTLSLSFSFISSLSLSHEHSLYLCLNRNFCSDSELLAFYCFRMNCRRSNLEGLSLTLIFPFFLLLSLSFFPLFDYPIFCYCLKFH